MRPDTKNSRPAAQCNDQLDVVRTIGCDVDAGAAGAVRDREHEAVGRAAVGWQGGDVDRERAAVLYQPREQTHFAHLRKPSVDITRQASDSHSVASGSSELIAASEFRPAVLQIQGNSPSFGKDETLERKPISDNGILQSDCS